MTKYADKFLSDLLVKNGFFPPVEVEQFLKETLSTNDSLYHYLVKRQLISEHQIVSALCLELNCDLITLKNIRIDQVVIDRVPVKFAWYYKFMPVKIEDKSLTIAISMPMEVKVLDEIRTYLGLDPKTVFTTDSDLNEAFNKYYGLAAETIDKVLTKDPSRRQSANESSAHAVEDLEHKSEDASVSRLVNQVILEAYQKRATDIHIEPYRNKVRIRYRIDGALVDANLPSEIKHLLLPMISRIKIMANLSIVEKRLPQDGSAAVRAKDQSLDLRVSTIPTPWGESMVIRLLPAKVTMLTLEKLGIDVDHLRIFRELVKKPHGIIFVTGPTGSGKTTTLYACLQEINSEQRKIITIEDPVEYEMEGITQIQVNTKVNLDFAAGLRSVLRHDPNIIMVGEVRDLETAEIAIRTALTGHLVFSTLHTNDAASGVTRLVDMGLEPFLVASSVDAFIAQRLVRTICPHCKTQDAKVPADLIQEMAHSLKIDTQEVKVFKGLGCERCNKTGFYGRTALYEFLLVSDAIQAAILEKPRAEYIRQLAMAEGMQTLRQNGWRKVISGVTTPSEVMNVTSREEEVAVTNRQVNSGSFSSESNIPESLKEFKGLADLSSDQRNLSSRAHPRLNVELPIRFKLNIHDQEQTESAQDVEQSALTRDLSAGGVCFLSRFIIPVGTVITLKVQLEGESRSLNCLAKVCRVEQDHQGNCYFISVTYLDMASADRAKINHFVAAKLKPENNP